MMMMMMMMMMLMMMISQITILSIFLTFPAEAIARARHEPDLVAVRRLEALLSWQVELGTKSAASELGVLPFLEQMLKE